jgi:hypothetical protein
MKAPIGARVSIRFHDPEGGFRDLVGYLESENSLRNRHGELIEFDVEKIAVYKVIEEKIHAAGHGAPLSIRKRARKSFDTNMATIASRTIW